MSHVAQQFEAWSTEDGVVLGTLASIAEQRSKGLLSSSAQLLYSISAHTWEEAQAIHHLRMGFEPYKPQGVAAVCSNCSALFYPAGSAQCWQCGLVVDRA